MIPPITPILDDVSELDGIRDAANYAKSDGSERSWVGRGVRTRRRYVWVAEGTAKHYLEVTAPYDVTRAEAEQAAIDYVFGHPR